MLRIRLRRTGQKHQPSYRLVVADQNAKRDGAFIEVVGHYNPRTEPSTVGLNEERVRYWISQGAQPSDTVHRILHARGLTATAPAKHASKPSRVEREAAEAATKAAAEARAAAAAEAEAKAKADEEAASAAAAEAETPAATAAETPEAADASDAPPAAQA